MFNIKFKRYIFIIQCIIFCHQYDLGMAIIGPNVKPANQSNFPGIVSIMKVNNFNPTQVQKSHRCTGTLISKQDILTAEHCIRVLFIEGFKIRAGSIDLNLAIEFFPLFILSYENWATFQQRTLELTDHDIAFVKLTENVPEDIPFLPTRNVDNGNLYGATASTAGWGKLQDNTIPRILHSASLTILSKRECENRIYQLEGERIELDDRRLCSLGNPYAVLNNGDSGGPLIYSNTLVGINNGICPIGEGPIRPHHINLHLGIRYYNEFIEDFRTSYYMHF